MSKTKDDNDLKNIIATGHTLPSVNPDLAEEGAERTPTSKRKKADPTDYIADLEREKDEDALDFEIN